MSSNTIRRAPCGIAAPRTSSVIESRSRPSGAGLQLERILPVVALAGLGARGVQLEALPHRLGEAAEPRHLVEAPAAVGRQRQAQDARRARVDGVDAPSRSNTITPAVRLSRMVCRLARAPSTWTTLRAPARAPRRAASVISANERVRPPSSSREREHRLRAEVAARHLAHALGEQQQRLRELVAERDREQQRAEHGEDERQRQRADVHLAQALRGPARAAGTRGRRWLHGQRVGGQAGRQRLGHDAGSAPARRARSCCSGSAPPRARAPSRRRAALPSSSSPSAWLDHALGCAPGAACCGADALGHQPARSRCRSRAASGPALPTTATSRAESCSRRRSSASGSADARALAQALGRQPRLGRRGR